MSRVLRLLPAVVLVPLLTACASAQAKSSSDHPSLNVPPPPPHEVQLPAEPLEPVAEVPGNTPAMGTGTPRPGRTSREAAPRSQATEPKPETKPDPPAAAPATNPDPAPALPPPPAPTPQLKTPQTADTSAAAKTVRTTIDRAKSTLAGVNYGPLSNERKKFYKDAQLFLKQAEDALKEGNIVFAQANATKAESLAKELASR